MKLLQLIEAKASATSADSIVKNANLITLLDDSATMPEIKISKQPTSKPHKTYLIYVATSLYIVLEYSQGGSTLGKTSTYNISKLLDGEIDPILKRNVQSIDLALIDIGFKKSQTRLKPLPKSVLAKFKTDKT